MIFSLFIQINNLNFQNLNIIKDNEAINKVLPPFPSLILANRIIKITPMKFKLSVQLKENHYGK